MKNLTVKEEEIMNHYWEHDCLQVRELRELYPEPKPHINTLSTLVHILEEKGFLGHRAISTRVFEYFARITREQYRRATLGNVVDKLFGRSYKSAISALVDDEKITVEELKELIREVESK